MNVEELLELMEETLEAGTAVPFAASKRVVDVDRMRDIIDEVRNNLPDEVRESKKIVNDREQIMKNARIESESIIQQAEEKARNLTSEQEIVRRSQQYAAEIVTKAQVDRVAYLVSHHHTLTDIDGIDYQILIEADYIVNAAESEYSKENIKGFIHKVMKTNSGSMLARQIFCV